MKKKIFTAFHFCLIGFLFITFWPASAISSENVIKIGVLGPHKFSMGLHSWWGAELAAEEINAAGGVSVGGVKYKIEAIKADSNEVLSVVDAVSAAERLVSVDKVNFVVGGHRSEAAMAVQELLAEKKVVFICVQAALTDLVKRVATDYDQFKYFFRTQTNGPEMFTVIFNWIEMIGNQIKKDTGVKKLKVAILAEKAAWTEGMVKGAPGLLEKIGMETVGVWRPSPTATDVSAELAAIKSSGAHIIFQTFSGPVGHVVARQWGQAKIPAALVGVNTEGGTLRHWQATDKACEYQVVHGYSGPANISDKTLPLYAKFKERHGEYPAVTAYSYDAVYVLMDAASRAGSLDRDKMVKALENTDYMGAMGRITFQPKGHQWAHDLIWGAKAYAMPASQWLNGELKVVWPDGVHGEKFKGLRYKGTVDYVNPPWLIEYWKKK